MGPKQMNCCRPEQMGTKEFGKMLKRDQTLEEGRVPAKEAKNWRIEGGKEKNYEKGVSEAGKKVGNERFNGAERLVEPGKGENH